MPLVKLAQTGEQPTPLLVATLIAAWATQTIADPTKAHTNETKILQKSSAALTTEQIGLRREEVGGIIVGVCLGLILAILLFWYCFGRRRSTWFPDTESEWSAPASPPLRAASSLPPPPPPPSQPGSIAMPSAMPSSKRTHSATRQEKLPQVPSIQPAGEVSWNAAPPQKIAHSVSKSVSKPRVDSEQPKSVPIPPFANPSYYKADKKELVEKDGITLAQNLDNGKTVGFARRKRRNDLGDEELTPLER